VSVTASRLGGAPITFDWSNLPRAEVRAADLEGPWRKLRARFSGGEAGFFDTPVDDALSKAAESSALAKSLLDTGKFQDCLFLGIGGSSLGPLSLLGALQDRCTSGVRFHFLENPDPLDWKATISALDPRSTLVCAVAKSGTTFETISLLLLALEWLGKSRLSSHVVAITDPEKGDLRAFASSERIPILEIAPSIGGRFSVFSPVGLFAAALAGLSVEDFLKGARQVRDYCEKQPLEKNPLLFLGHELIRQFPKRPIHVCMPYSTRLRTLGDWFVQLWAESLGKDGKGFTPIAALGATDQHSILQLLRDGPDDKVTFFITVDQVEDEVRIPKLTTHAPLGSHGLPAFKLLEGHTLQELLRIEYQAVTQVLTKKGRPSFVLQLDRIDERSLGALYFALSVLTSATGALWDVNPFDQPGVEEGKIYIRRALGDAASQESQTEDDNSPVARLRRQTD
jgi:glucose-6-phosphate isomerase